MPWNENLRRLLVVAVSFVAPLDLAHGDAAQDCEQSQDAAAQILACTTFLEYAKKNGAPAEILSEAHTIRGLARQAAAKPDEALEDFDAAIRLEPNESVHHYNRGQLLVQAKADYASAIEALDRALALNPRLTPAWSNKGMALLKVGKIDEGLSCFLKAVEIDPDFAFAHANVGWVYEVRGKKRDAIAAYRRAVAIDPAMRAQILTFSKIDPTTW